MTAKTRADLIQYVVERFGRYRKLTATSGSTSTVLDTATLIEPDDFWVGHLAYVLTDAAGLSAAPQGQERPVTDYVQSTATLTVAPAFTVAVAVGDIVELLPVRRGVIVDAINEAIRSAGETWPVVKKDTTTVNLADADYEYSLPTDMVRLLDVWHMANTGDPYYRVPHRNWHVEGTPGAQVLYFDRLTGLDTDGTIMLQYVGYPSELSADTTALGVGDVAERELVQFVIERALAWLHERAASENVGAFREHMTLAQQGYDRAETMQRFASPWRPPSTVRGAAFPRTRR